MAKPKLTYVPETLDLALYAGDGVSIRLGLTTGDAPVVVTGVMRAQIRPRRSSSEISAEFTATPQEGAVIISLSGEQTQSLVTGEAEEFEGVWDLQWVPEGGEPKTLVQGNVKCNADVTR
jgi:hypothetical protein